MIVLCNTVILTSDDYYDCNLIYHVSIRRLFVCCVLRSTTTKLEKEKEAGGNCSRLILRSTVVWSGRWRQEEGGRRRRWPALPSTSPSVSPNVSFAALPLLCHLYISTHTYVSYTHIHMPPCPPASPLFFLYTTFYICSHLQAASCSQLYTMLL